MSSTGITFARLTSVPLTDLIAHMNDPRLIEHMPLLTMRWDQETAAQFVRAKEVCWQRDGLGHWAFMTNGRYAGWGGFQKEGEEWDFGLVLKPDCFGLGIAITREALAYARTNPRMPYVTFLVPPARKKLGALKRLGADFVGNVDYAGEIFGKCKLSTE